MIIQYIVAWVHTLKTVKYVLNRQCVLMKSWSLFTYIKPVTNMLKTTKVYRWLLHSAHATNTLDNVYTKSFILERETSSAEIQVAAGKNNYRKLLLKPLKTFWIWFDGRSKKPTKNNFSAIGQHLLDNHECARNYKEENFSVLVKAENSFQLHFLETLCIQSLRPS